MDKGFNGSNNFGGCESIYYVHSLLLCVHDCLFSVKLLQNKF